jgi:hypothetical protein
MPIGLVQVGAAMVVLVPLSLGAGYIIFNDHDAREARGRSASWRMDLPAGSSSQGDLNALCVRLRSAPNPAVPAGARERAEILHEIGRLRTAESRAFLLKVAQNPGNEIIERLAAVSALGDVGDMRALNEIAAATTETLVQAKIDAVRRKNPGQRGGKA